MKKLILITMIAASGFSANAAQEWVKLDSATVKCDLLSGSITAGKETIAYFPYETLAGNKAYRRCLISVAQARQEGKAVMVNINGDIVPENGFFIRLW